ncbi:MAG TPA: glycosyltransferase family 39 protein [Pyrinomonadaceae bacterium]|nr:glycosyltransferase family 39 protein [Pyrinomonadaceae bacterium]
MEDALKKQDVSVASGETVVTAFAHLYASAKRLVIVRKAEAVCGALLLLMAVNLFAAISRKSITNDEIVHIPAGYYHLVAGEFQLNNEHPPLVKMWAALPLLIVQPDEPPAPKTDDENFMERTWGFHERFWQANQARFQTVTFWPRLMMIPITLALGALIFVLARKLFGETAALIAVALYVLEPTVLAHGRVVHTDVPAALAYLLFFFVLHRYSEAPGTKRALILGLVCGVALLTKFSMLVLLPVLAIYFLARLFIYRRDRKQLKQILFHSALITEVVLFLVNAAYYFQRPVLEASDVRWVAMKSPALVGFVTTFVRLASYLVPTYYLFGVYNIELHIHFGHATSLLGQYNDLGWWYYFPVAFALKTTIPFLLLAIVALGWSVWRFVRRDWRFLWLVVPVGIYLAISLTSHINIGIRHFLPIYPFLFIAGGALLAQLLQARRLVGIPVLILLLGWMSFEAMRTFPNYTPYMNQLASGHPHWYYLSDSNVEWGDDVNALADYLKARGETKVSAALSAGWSTLGRYGVDYLDMVSLPPDKTPETRYVAIGASFLNGSVIPGDENVVGRRSFERTNLFARYRDRKPEAVFGNSIYLFREHE